MCQTISCSGVILKYSLRELCFSDGYEGDGDQVTAAVGTTRSQKSRKICIRMLRVSMNQNGYAYRQLLAVRFSSVQRPLNRAGAPSHISSEPTSLRMGVNGVTQVPRPTVTWLAIGCPHSDLAAALEVNRADMQLLPYPPRHVYVGSALDGDIVLDGEQVERSGERCVVRALKVVTHGRSEPPQHERHKRRAAKQHTQRPQGLTVPAVRYTRLADASCSTWGTRPASRCSCGSHHP